MFKAPVSIESVKIVDLSNSRFEAHFGGKKRLANESVCRLVSRWLAVFENHAVERSQIPRLFPAFDLSPGDLDNEVSIAELLRPSLQDATCALFNVRQQWLVSGDGRYLETALLDRDIDSWLRTLEEIRRNSLLVDLIVCRTTEAEIEDDRGQGGALILRWPIQQIGGNSVYAYKPVFTFRSWNDNESLYLAIRAMMVAHAMRCRLWGVTVNEDQITPLAEATQWPGVILDPCWFHSWYPADYLYDQTSPRAKWTEAREWVLGRCNQDGSTALLHEARARNASKYLPYRQ